MNYFSFMINYLNLNTMTEESFVLVNNNARIITTYSCMLCHINVIIGYTSVCHYTLCPMIVIISYTSVCHHELFPSSLLSKHSVSSTLCRIMKQIRMAY